MQIEAAQLRSGLETACNDSFQLNYAGNQRTAGAGSLHSTNQCLSCAACQDRTYRKVDVEVAGSRNIIRHGAGNHVCLCSSAAGNNCRPGECVAIDGHRFWIAIADRAQIAAYCVRCGSGICSSNDGSGNIAGCACQDRSGGAAGRRVGGHATCRVRGQVEVVDGQAIIGASDINVNPADAEALAGCNGETGDIGSHNQSVGS